MSEIVDGLNYFPKNSRSCFVYGCFSTAVNKPHLGFHKFPPRGKRNIVVTKKNGDNCIYDRRQIWIDALNISRDAAEAIDGVDVYVCSLHFARDDFYYNQDITGRRYLKELAIPRRNLPARKSSAFTTKFYVRPLNRLKRRGHFSIHNPDGRKLTTRRRFLGPSQPKEGANSQSYTKTVWVVRKPKDQTQEDDTDQDHGVDSVNVENTFSLAEDPEEEIDVADDEDDDQITIVNETENTQPSANAWCTSELIIKEESVSEEDSSDSTAKKPDEGGTEEPLEPIASEDNEDDDENCDPNKLVIQTEDDTEQDHLDEVPLPTEDIEDTDLPQIEDFEQLEEEDFEAAENGYEEAENQNEEAENGYDQTENENLEYYETNEEAYEGGEEYQEGYENEEEFDYGEYYSGMCHICGVHNCEAHHQAASKDDFFVCLICSDIFGSQKQLAFHSAIHSDMTEEELLMHEERKRSLTCDFCGRVLSTKATLREHIMIHTGEKPNQCMLCGKSFRHKANLVVHVNSHAVVSTYKCRKCNEAFTRKRDFEEHLQVHVDKAGNLLVCKICNAVFKSQRTLYNHSQLHTRKGSIRTKKRNNEPKDPTFTCKYCGKILSTKATLKEHTMIHTGEKPHECPICGRTIRHKANYIVHLQTHGHGKSFECDMCDQAFMRKSDLTHHKQSEHSKSKLLRCPICSEVFKSPQKFNRHMEIHESVVYMNETEELAYVEDEELTYEEAYDEMAYEEEDEMGFQPHMLEGFLES